MKRKMKEFKVVFEIETIGLNPISIAKDIHQYIKENKPMFYVQDIKTKEMFSVDLSEENEEDMIIPIKNFMSIIE